MPDVCMPLVRSDGYPVELCDHPAHRIEWRRDRPWYRWVGICRKCGAGRTLRRGDEPIVRTDEQLARGEVPPIPACDRAVAQTSRAFDYEPW